MTECQGLHSSFSSAGTTVFKCVGKARGGVIQKLFLACSNGSTIVVIRML